MPGFLDLPLELRNQVYEYLLYETFEPQTRGVIAVSEKYIKEQLPLRCYRGLLRVCRQIYTEFQDVIRHMTVAKDMNYELDIAFTHGRPFLSLRWIQFPGLSSVINSITINVDLRLREPLDVWTAHAMPPAYDELTHLLEDPPANGPKHGPGSFAHQLFDYIALLLKTLVQLMKEARPDTYLLYTEAITLNLRTPTCKVATIEHDSVPRRVLVDNVEASRINRTMRNTLKSKVQAFHAYPASETHILSPLIQIGVLRFATEGIVWGQGNNLVLAENDFKWLRYGEGG